ncbi:unnamed protein product [Ixodes persulcatus]
MLVAKKRKGQNLACVTVGLLHRACRQHITLWRPHYQAVTISTFHARNKIKVNTFE